jgi:tetratricopeptide (TPR) repeat protein
MMKAIREIAIAALGLVLAWAVLSPSSGAQQQSTPPQQGQQQQQQQQQPPQQGAPSPGPQPVLPAEAPKVDPAEEKAYKEFFDLKSDDYDKQIELGEAFVKQYPQSQYDETVYGRLTNAYYSKRQPEKMYAAADKALALNPDDVAILVLVGWVVPHTYDPNDPETPRRLEKAENYEKHALDVLPKLSKPSGLTDEQFASAKAHYTAMAHSGLGLVYFRQQKVEDSAKEMQQATAGVQSDPVDFLVLGIDLNSLKRYNEAADAFQKCAQIPGQLQEQCKEHADKAKTQAAQPQK